MTLRLGIRGRGARRDGAWLRGVDRAPGQPHGEAAAATDFARHRHRAAVQFRKPFHHRESQARAFDASRDLIGDLREGREQLSGIVGANTNAGVGD